MRRSALILAVALPAAACMGASEARAAGAVTEPVVLANNATCFGGDAGFPCEGLNVAVPVRAQSVRWSVPPDQVEYRFFACPAAALDEAACTTRTPWQQTDEVVYPAGDAGAWAAVQVRGIYPDGPSPTATSDTRRLASQAQLNPDASIQITGLLPDGTARSGMVIDAGIDVPAGAALFTGVPEPRIYRTWHFDRKPFHGFVSPSHPYDGPFAVPEVDELSFSVSASNIVMGDRRSVEIKVRVKPHPLKPLPQLRPLPRVTVGRKIRYRATAPPAPAFAGFPAPVIRWRWQRCTLHGCRDIAGARYRAYTPRRRDLGRTLRLTLRAENPEGRARIPVLRTLPVRASLRPVPAAEPKSTV